MKPLLLVGYVLILVLQSISAGFAPLIIKHCVKEVDVKSVELALFYGTDMKDASKHIKCYLTCVFKSSGFIVDNEINPNIVEAVKTKTTSNDNPQIKLFFQMIDACKSVKGNEECDTGYLLFKCFSDYGKAHLFGFHDSTKS